MENNGPAAILVIFGISGDLSQRFLLPALAEINRVGSLPKDFKIIGISRSPLNLQEILQNSLESLQPYCEPLQMDLELADSYYALHQKIQTLSNNFGSQPEIIYYLSVPPFAVLPIIKHLGPAGLNLPSAKLLLEKPFGTDLDSARNLIAEIANHFSQEQVYRVDHYLAKEMAQNIVVFLGSNSLFRGIWNNHFVEKIEIEALEQIGVEGRANFYESTGALRDLVQSHLLQLAALTLMEPCSSMFEFEELPARRLAALKGLRADLNSVRRGQYQGYKNDVNNQDSQVETFVQLGLKSDNPRWEGVPVILTTGKRLNEKRTQIRIHFKKTNNAKENLLVLGIQPKEGIELKLWVKQPGYERQLQKLPLEFKYDKHFERLPEAYEQVLVDVMQSNQSLFASGDEVLASWEILQPVLDQWATGSSDLIFYKPGNSIYELLEHN